MTDTTYKITVVKRFIDSAVTSSNVRVTLYGENGTSEDISLENTSNNFNQGGVEIFSIASQELGNISKIRIQSNKDRQKPGLALTSVVLDNEITGKEWVCPCNKWSANDESGNQTEWELNCSKV